MAWGPTSTADALVSVADYQTWFNTGTLTGADLDRVTMAIDMASDAVRSYTGQRISVVTETITLDATGDDALLLPEGPVTAVSAVTRDGVTLAASTYSWVAPSRLIRSLDSSRWTWPQVITVAYTHGYTQTPRDLAGVVLGRAKRWLDDPLGQPIQSETLGSWSVTYATSGEGSFTVDEQQILDRYALWTYAY